ncbi:MAG: 2-hydroxycarboxylate transporter family protein, partial [Lachnospiraceae bacterium]|nr:2-hydroxycarboxylate transporter family protein [Lachnospiraceae bacterium]
MKKLSEIKIIGIPLPIYAFITAVVLLVMFMGWMPDGMIGAFAVMMVLGGLFNVIGNNTPIIKTFLGGGAIVCIFASAAMVYLKIIPENVIENVDSFMNTTGFLSFYIAALITGSILGMNRNLLLKAAVRFLPVALCAMTMAILAVGVVGMIVGYGFVDAIMYVA